MPLENVGLRDQPGLDRQHYLAGDVAKFSSRRSVLSDIEQFRKLANPITFKQSKIDWNNT